MKVTVNTPANKAKPSEADVQQAEVAYPVIKNGVVTIALKDNRQIGVRRMGPLGRMRMCSIIGAENSKNEIYLSMAVPAFCTASIDGDTVPPANTVLALEATAERLGDAALLQITLALSEHFPEGDLTSIVDEFKKRQEIKN